MTALVLAALIACPLMSGGVMVYPTHAGSAWGYRVYIQNPSGFPFEIDEIEFVMRDGSNEDSFHGVHFSIKPFTIKPHASISLDLGDAPGALNPPLMAGAHIPCAGEG